MAVLLLLIIMPLSPEFMRREGWQGLESLFVYIQE
jgi:hypothetical protein